MNIERLFPATIIVLQLGATIGYAISGSWPKSIYWFLAAAMNAAVTFFMR